ncbi:MAG: sarcosine oxidase subunit beta family protein [Pseudomonadota bacterium]
MAKRLSYSAGELLRQGLRKEPNWPKLWRDQEPRRSYDVVVVGAGGHGLAAAYYLAKLHGADRVAVLEKGWLGGGATARNTTVVRSNYFYPESAKFYDFSLSLWKGLSKELNYNVMFSPRGMWMLSHDRHGDEMLRRSVNAMLLNNVQAEYHKGDAVRSRIPHLNPAPRFPIWSGVLQPDAGTARHDAVAWGYARAADALGVDIIQGCEVTGFDVSGSSVTGVRTNKGPIASEKVVLSVAGHTPELARLAGIEIPAITYCLQAFVTEPVKPFLDTVVLSPATGVYLSQSDKGEMVIGGGLDLFPSYAQRGSPEAHMRAAAGVIELFPSLSRLRFLRQWAGVLDVVHDSSPILGLTDVKGFYLNCGWGTGGFKATPAGGFCLAATITEDRPHPLIKPFGLERFTTGAMIDEAAASGIAH